MAGRTSSPTQNSNHQHLHASCRCLKLIRAPPAISNHCNAAATRTRPCHPEAKLNELHDGRGSASALTCGAGRQECKRMPAHASKGSAAAISRRRCMATIPKGRHIHAKRCRAKPAYVPPRRSSRPKANCSGSPWTHDWHPVCRFANRTT